MSDNFKSARFARKYRQKGIYKFEQSTQAVGIDFTFEPWHHFLVLRDGKVVVYVWDTRQVVCQCTTDNLPNTVCIDASKVDNHETLVDYDTAVTPISMLR